MFRFQALDVYHSSKKFSLEIRSLISNLKIDQVIKDQLRRASLSIVLNLAEGSGRFSEKDMRRFYVISRSSLFECMAIIDILHAEKAILGDQHRSYFIEGETISKQIYQLIKKGK